MGDGPASLSGCSTVGRRSCRRRRGGQVRAAAAGGPQPSVNSWVHAVSQGQSFGRCKVIRRAEDAIRAGTVISVRRIVAVVDVARVGSPVSGGGRAGEVERDHGEHEPGGVRGELPRREVREGGALQVGVYLFDDRVVPVGLVRGHGVQGVGG